MGQRFFDIAHEHASRVALLCANEAPIDYATLDVMSDQAAGYMLEAGVRKGDVVALFAEKSPWVYAAMIGALKIGAPYVGLDTASPAARLEKIFAACKPKLILADRELPLSGQSVRSLSAIKASNPELPPHARTAVQGSDPAYIMFTSGSTGIPKGVVIAHHSMVRFCDWARETFAITPDDRLSGVNALYFDNSVFDFCASLFNGAALVPVTRDVVTNPMQLSKAVSACTVWFSVPSLLIYLLSLRALTKTSWSAMRAIIFGGEGFAKADLKRLHDMYHAQATLWNVYGPTECTCICSAYAISNDDVADLSRLAPLGHMASIFTAAVMDESGTKAVPNGETGELFLMGPQVAIGYCNDAERTTASFAKNPLFPEKPCYRTGDLVTRDAATGYYHFAGRKDNQVKHMGYRIELEEIEAALNAMNDTGESAVIYHRGSGPAGRIIAYVTGRVKPDEVKARLRAALPSYMIPEEIIHRDPLPKNANGKTDRKALAAEYGAKHA